MPEGGEGPRPPIIKPGRDSEGYLIKREGFPKPPAEPVKTPYRNADGSLVRFDDPDRLPTAFTRLKSSVSNAIDRFNEGFERGLDKIFGGKEPSENPTGEVVDLHGPIDDPTTLSPDDAYERQLAKGRHPSTLGEVLADDPNARENARIEEIAGRTHPGTDAPFVDVPEKPYRWDDDHDIAVTTTPVTELAGAGTYQEVVEARQLGEQGREGAQAQPGLRLVVDNDPKKGRKPTPPDDNGGGTAA